MTGLNLQSRGVSITMKMNPQGCGFGAITGSTKPVQIASLSDVMVLLHRYPDLVGEPLS
jgi:hypothetical protein